MSESKRATWREFVEWMSDRDGRVTGEGEAIARTARLVRSRHEAHVAFEASHGWGDKDFDRVVDEWLASLRPQGISPPADPPSVAEVLESVAVELDGAALASEDQRVKCVVSGPASESASVYWEGEEAAFRDASGRVRAKAKEFT